MNEAVSLRALRNRFKDQLTEHLNVELGAVLSELDLGYSVDSVLGVFALADAASMLDQVERHGDVMCAVVMPPTYRYTSSYTGSPSEYEVQREQAVDVVLVHRATHRDYVGGYTLSDLEAEGDALEVSQAYLGAIINVVRQYVPCGASGIRVSLAAANITNSPMLERMGTYNTITTSWDVAHAVTVLNKMEA